MIVLQESIDPTIVGLIVALIIAILVIIILIAKVIIKTKKPYQFSDDITDLNKIFKVVPIPITTPQEPVQTVSVQPSPSISPPSLPQKIVSEGTQYE